MSFAGFSEEDIKKLNRNAQNIKFEMVKKKSIKAPKLNGGQKPSITTVKQPKQQNDIQITLQEETTLELEPPELPQIVQKAPPPPTSPLKHKPIDLDEFQNRQKLIEEQNRKRKELLSRALAARTKQTQEEAQRLNEIEGEFRKLDAILSNDVQILRKQIDAASHEYMEAQKKYDKIEKEFLDAKLALFTKLEKKQLLTEHLCAIIEKNEERKAEKLRELLNKLNVDEVKDATNNDIMENS